MNTNSLLLAQIINDSYDNQEMLLRLLNNTEEQSLEEYFLLGYSKHIRTPGFSEEWLPLYLDYDFFQLFRFTRASVYLLLKEIDCPELNKQFSGGEISLQGEKMLLMTLWWLGKGETLLSVSDKFNVCVSAVHRSLELILQKIVAMKNKYIQWPNHNELVAIERNFREIAGFPGAVGAIDCCNITFKAPAQQQESYIDRKLRHSIKLQGICINSKVFTNVMVGFGGSVHDSRVLQNCAIFNEVENVGNGGKYFSLADYHLLGDSAYPLLNWLMT